MNRKKKIILCFIIFLGLLPFILPGKNDTKEVVNSESAAMTATPAESAMVATPVQLPEKQNEKIKYISKYQQQLLDDLLFSMSRYQLKDAALLLHTNELILQRLLNETLDGQTYLYRDGEFTDDLHGKGLIIVSPSVVFYGEFNSAGKPDGFATALQSTYIDQLRYDYSTGIWLDGQMEGMGEIGYEYYGEDPGVAYELIKKRGYFSRDLMTGEVEYSSSQQGAVFTWMIHIDKGVIRFDERWTYIEEENKYRIPSAEDPGHVYAVNRELAEKIQWKNMISWNFN